MSRKTPQIFEFASEAFYLHLCEMEPGDSVVLERHVFRKRENGSLYLSNHLADYVCCIHPDCETLSIEGSLWACSGGES